MSSNLYFEVKGGGNVDFPFQTPTVLTHAVLAEKNPIRRYDLLEQYLHSTWGKKDSENTLNTIRTLMGNSNLILSEI